MNTVLHRLRGLMGLGFVGGCLGALFGAGSMMLKNLTMFGSILGLSIAESATGWGVFGALAGSGFGLVLTMMAGRRRLQELNFWRAAILGGVVGVSLPVVWFGTQLGWTFPILVLFVLPQAAMCGAFGMLLGSGLVAVAKDAESRELLSTDDASLLLEVPDDR